MIHVSKKVGESDTDFLKRAFAKFGRIGGKKGGPVKSAAAKAREARKREMREHECRKTG